MSKIILFLLFFFYIYPVYFSFIPIPTDRIIQLFGVIAFIITPESRNQLLRNRKILSVICVALILIVLALFAQLRVGFSDLYFVKLLLNSVLHIFSAYLLVVLSKNYLNDFNYVKLFDIIIICSLIQALVSFFFFFNPAIYEGYASLLNAGANQGLLSRLSRINKRLLGVGNGFFSGVINYSFSILIVAILPYLKSSWIARNKFWYWISFFVIVIAGVLTGRTFIVALALAAVMIFILEGKHLFNLLIKIIKFTFLFLLVAFAFYEVLKNYVDLERFAAITNFAFEIFINYLETGEIQTSSSDHLIDMYRFPDNNITWILGDGRMQEPGGNYYKNTDVGYIRLIYYFGVIATALFIGAEFYYARIVSILVKSKEISVLIYIIFGLIFIYNFKGLTLGDSYFMLFLVCLGLTENTDDEE